MTKKTLKIAYFLCFFSTGRRRFDLKWVDIYQCDLQLVDIFAKCLPCLFKLEIFKIPKYLFPILFAKKKKQSYRLHRPHTRFSFIFSKPLSFSVLICLRLHYESKTFSSCFVSSLSYLLRCCCYDKLASVHKLLVILLVNNILISFIIVYLSECLNITYLNSLILEDYIESYALRFWLFPNSHGKDYFQRTWILLWLTLSWRRSLS